MRLTPALARALLRETICETGPETASTNARDGAAKERPVDAIETSNEAPVNDEWGIDVEPDCVPYTRDDDEATSVPRPLREDNFSQHFAETLKTLKARLDQHRERTSSTIRVSNEPTPDSSQEIESVAIVKAPILGLPEGTRWHDVRIHRIDGHTISVRVGSIHRRFSYQDVGLASVKNREPVKQWDILMALCEHHGTLSWPPTDALRRQVSALRQTLRGLFAIEEDPLVYVWGAGYRARFQAFDG